MIASYFGKGARFHLCTFFLLTPSWIASVRVRERLIKQPRSPLPLWGSFRASGTLPLQDVVKVKAPAGSSTSEVTVLPTPGRSPPCGRSSRGPGPGTPRSPPAGGGHGSPPARGGPWLGPRVEQAAAGPELASFSASHSALCAAARRTLAVREQPAVRGSQPLCGPGGVRAAAGRSLSRLSLQTRTRLQPRPGELRRWRRWDGRRRGTAASERAPLPGRGHGSPALSGFFLVSLKSAHPRAWRGMWREGGGRGKWPIMWGTRHAQLALFFPSVSTNLANFSGPRVYVVPGRRRFPLEEGREKSWGFGRPLFAPRVRLCLSSAFLEPAHEPGAGLGIRVSRIACLYPPYSEQQNRKLVAYLRALYGCRKCKVLPRVAVTAVLYRSSVAVGLGVLQGPFQQSCSISKQ